MATDDRSGVVGVESGGGVRRELARHPQAVPGAARVAAEEPVDRALRAREGQRHPVVTGHPQPEPLGRRPRAPHPVVGRAQPPQVLAAPLSPLLLADRRRLRQRKRERDRALPGGAGRPAGRRTSGLCECGLSSHQQRRGGEPAERQDRHGAPRGWPQAGGFSRRQGEHGTSGHPSG